MYVRSKKIFLSLVLVSAICSFAACSAPTSPAPSLNTDKFAEMFKDTELNSSLAIQIMQPGIVLTGPTPSPYNIAFVVLNRSNESVIFSDQSFQVQVFWLDPAFNSWQKINLTRTLKSIQKRTLPPNLNSWDPRIDNSEWLVQEYFPSFKYDRIRLYVSGIGETSLKKYGAYVDWDLRSNSSK